jgi:hypothetical protein
MGADKNSTQEFGLWTQDHSDTSINFYCQIHIATGVPLDHGARSNQQPLKTRIGKQHEQSCWKPKPVRSVSETSYIDSLGLSLSRAGETGQDGLAEPVRLVLSKKSPKDLRDQKLAKPPQEPNKLWTRKAIAWKWLSCPKTLHDSPLGLSRSDRFGKPVRSVLPRQSGRTQPVGITQPSPWLISRFVQRIQVRL